MAPKEAYDDAQDVAEVFEGVDKTDAKFFYIEALVKIGNHKEALAMLSDDEDVFKIAERILLKAELEETTENLVLFLKGILVRFTQINQALGERIGLIRNSFELQTKFSDFDITTQEAIPNKSFSSVTMAKLYSMAKLSNKTFEEVIETHVKDWDPKELAHLSEMLIENQFDVQGLDHLFKHNSQISSVNVNNVFDPDKLEEMVQKSSQTHWIESLKQRCYDNSVFKMGHQDDNDTDLIGLEKKLQANLFKDKGLPIQKELVEASSDLLETFKRFKVSVSNDNDGNITAPLMYVDLNFRW